MQCKWLKKDSDRSVVNLGSKSLIVFFCGWGLDESVVSHLSVDGYDVLMVSDYRDLDFPISDDFQVNDYGQRILVAWSFGIAAAAKCISQGLAFQFDQQVAINGSMQAVDRYLGIPEVVMQKTIDTLSQQSFELFTKRCYGKQKPGFDAIKIDVAARKQELEDIRDQEYVEINGWDIVWQGSQDKIFPIANLSRAWQEYNSRQDSSSQADIRLIDVPHVPFNYWTHWRDIVL